MRDTAEHAICWHVYPLGLLGAESTLAETPDDPNPRLRDLIGWLDHLVELGCNVLLLGPIFTASTHGYDTLDHFSIDPRLGTLADARALFEAASERGIRVVADGVFNHIGREHPLAQAALAAGPGTPEGDLLVLDRDDAGNVVAENFEGHDALVTLNHANPAVAELVREAMTYWLDRGVDGWRLDAAYAVPADFWAQVLPEVRAAHPQAWFLGEMIHGDYAQYVHTSGLDSVTQYELWKAIWSGISTVNLFELEWTLGRHAQFVTEYLPTTFVGNHDVTRLASQITDERHRGHAVAVLMFVPGVPCVYYGDEFGLTGVKTERVGGDDAIRPALTGPAQAARAGDAGVLSLYRQLIAMRRRYPWLASAELSTDQVSNASMQLIARGGEDSQLLTLVLNLGDEPVPGPGGEVIEHGLGEVGDGQVGGHSWAVFGSDGVCGRDGA